MSDPFQARNRPPRLAPWRYWRVLQQFWSTALASQVEYRVNILVDLLGMAGNLCGSLFLLSLFFRQGQLGLGGWSWPAAVVVLGVYTMLEGLAALLLRPNLGQLVRHVQEGTLDFVLLKPLDSQFWVSFRTLSPAGFPDLLAGMALVVWGAHASDTPRSPWIVLTTAAMLLSSAMILYSLWFVIAATTIWFVKTWNATEVLRALLGAGRYPRQAFPPGLRLLFTLVLPVTFLTTVPAEAVLGQVSITWLLASCAVAALGLTTSRAFWNFALRFYTSASS
jgi:ABC-2 type transport system permease protein